MKRLIALFLALACLGGLAFGQNRVAFQIQCNQSGAQVFVNGRLVGTTNPNLATLLAVGSYQIMVAKTGFQPYQANVTVPASGLNLTVNLIPKGAVAPPPPPAQPTTFALTVLAPQPTAWVSIDGKDVGKAPVTVQVAPGTHLVVVKAPAFLDWSQNVQVINGPVTVNAGLQAPPPPPPPPSHQLSVNANVAGAQVFINGNPAGQVPFQSALPPGSYSLVVRAPGYLDYNESFVINGSRVINANLQPQAFQLTVNANVGGAQVIINGATAGQVPFQGALPPGSYNLVVRAPGYSDYSESFQMTGPRMVSATLQPAAAGFQISLPASSVNTDLKGGHWSQIQVYIDGVLQKAPGREPFLGGQLLPGRRLIRVTSGGLAVETFIDVQAGKSYVLEPFMGLTVK